MKACPTCGMTAEDRASFCPCCGSSFVERKEETAPAPTPVPTEVPPKTTAATQPLLFEEKEKKGGHALPIVIISVLATVAVCLGALWATGGLKAMFQEDVKPAETPADTTLTAQPLPSIAATYGNGQELTTQQYLAYLYLEFENIYYNQGLYQQETIGLDPWEQTFPYGENGEELSLSDYIIRATQDNIKRQIVLAQMLKDNGLTWIAEDEAALEWNPTTLSEETFNEMGFNNESYEYAMKNLNLNERSLFYGLYKAGGPRAVSELDLRQYFVTNYVSYKMISIPLTDQNGVALSPNHAEYDQILAKMSNYMTICQESGFNTAYVLHTGSSAENARMDEDTTTMDAALAQAVRTVPIGATSIVEFNSGNTPYIALIQRLDLYEDASLFDDSIENILYTLHYEAFAAEVDEAIAELSIAFDTQVVQKGNPREMCDIVYKK